jgi:HD-GYP domain-containing protein (c-di-GMP phosphodiesterase class II)
LKSGELTEEEFQEIKMHPIYGEEILKHIKQLHDIIPGVKFHHERYDGLGYPENLAGKEIDLTARIVAVADSFDAMTTNRSYKDALPLELALDELRINAGTQFDPLIVNAFLHGCETGIVKLWR